MKQLYQNMKNGTTELVECPYPSCRKGSVIIKTDISLVSLGTEKMLVNFGKSNILQKARQQPEKVKQVFDKVKTEGLLTTIESVREKLDEPLPLGYCNTGVVVETNGDVADLNIGDRVVSNGPHAEFVMVPEKLVAKIPDGVSAEHAVFTVVGSIGLQGLRLAQPTLGETVVVIGLGLIGQLTAQLAHAYGADVIAFDIDPHKVSVAKSFGINAMVSDSPDAKVQSLTEDVGADCVLITASGTSEKIISQAAAMCRKRGRIVLVGVIPLSINRSEFYEKELSFQVSCSYGPGRYDPEYENRGHDYPLAYVRWTEKRNFEAVLQCIATNRINPAPLITERVSFSETPSLYAHLGEGKSIASIITYSTHSNGNSSKSIQLSSAFVAADQSTSVAVIGSGNFTKMALLPGFKKVGMLVKYICSQSGGSAAILARKYGIPVCTSDVESIVEDKDIKALVITTRHRSHTDLILKGVENGKHVFVEKPMAVDRTQLQLLSNFFSKPEPAAKPSLTVGFNRRYSPFAEKIKRHVLRNSTAITMVYTMNAGKVPATHWLMSSDEGGRIIGEACHCIDLFVYFSGSQVVEVSAQALGKETETLSDNVSILLKAENGSLCTINYFSNGSKQYMKEHVTVFSGKAVLEIENFKKMKSFGCATGNSTLMVADKGHNKQFEMYRKFLNGESVLRNSLAEHFNVSEASIAAIDSLVEKKMVKVSTY